MLYVPYTQVLMEVNSRIASMYMYGISTFKEMGSE